MIWLKNTNLVYAFSHTGGVNRTKEDLCFKNILRHKKSINHSKIQEENVYTQKY